ncbi:MAG TPA: hypothetical protein VFN09_07010 [Rhodanobacteraceae bacterium]|nr:hypothetical protein [Rhodanobacteraceae bacterium]
MTGHFPSVSTAPQVSAQGFRWAWFSHDTDCETACCVDAVAPMRLPRRNDLPETAALTQIIGMISVTQVPTMAA